MEWIFENWYLIVALIAIIWSAAYALYKFYGLPSAEQTQKVREWLLYAVIIAEKELGSGTGQLKLRYVYDLFLNKFPWMARILSFDAFSSMVDEALDEMKHLIATNEHITEFVEGGTNE